MRIVMIVVLVLLGTLAGAAACYLHFVQNRMPLPGLTVLLVVLSVILISAATALISMRPRPASVAASDLDAEVVPLHASFTGLVGVPLLALAHNSLAPRLELKSDCLTYRVLANHTRSYADIDRVDANGKRHLTFVWRNSPFSFTASVANDADRPRILAALDAKGVRLTPAARALLAAFRGSEASRT